MSDGLFIVVTVISVAVLLPVLIRVYSDWIDRWLR